MALKQAFNADTLADLRQAVLLNAAQAGMSAEQAAEVMLAAHELAANAVRYGGGAGLLQLYADLGELHCQVTDAGPGAAAGAAGSASAQPWPLTPGHGLWLVHKIAQRVSVACRLGGSTVTATFTLP